MKIPTDSPLPIAKGQRISEDVPNDGLLNKNSLLIHDEQEILEESQQKMDDLSQSDWDKLSKYRKKYNQEQQAKQQPPAGADPNDPTGAGGGTIGTGIAPTPNEQGFTGNAQPQQQAGTSEPQTASGEQEANRQLQ